MGAIPRGAATVPATSSTCHYHQTPKPIETLTSLSAPRARSLQGAGARFLGKPLGHDHLTLARRNDRGGSNPSVYPRLHCSVSSFSFLTARAVHLPLKREQNSQVTPLLSTRGTRKTTRTQVFSGGTFPCRGHFWCAIRLARGGCTNQASCIRLFHLLPPPRKEIQAVLLCRYFPLEKKKK